MNFYQEILEFLEAMWLCLQTFHYLQINNLFLIKKTKFCPLLFSMIFFVVTIKIEHFKCFLIHLQNKSLKEF